MVNWSSKRIGDWLLLLNSLVAIIVINQLASLYFFRIDMTEEKRFSIKPQTIELLQSIDDEVFVEVFLEGNLNPGFTRIKNYTREMLEEFRVYSDNKIRYTFTNPEEAASQSARSEFMNSLAQKGINPMNVVDNRNGQRSEKLVFPGALISYGGFESGVMFLKGSTGRGSPQEVLNQAVEDVEFELANAIHKLVSTNQKKIGWVVGHGELDSLHTASLVNALLEQYQVFKIDLAEKKRVTGYDLLIVAKPIRKFSQEELYKLDQYIVDGGKVIFLIDRLDATMEKASDENYYAFPTDINLDDMLFRYGVRINLDIVQDVSSLKYPIVTGVTNGRPQITPLDWPFFPMVNHYASHPATRNLDASIFKFASSIDTVKSVGIKKTPLIFTSQYSRILGAPVQVSAASLRSLKPENFQGGSKPLAYLLEGSFSSMFKNRFKPEGVDEATFKETGAATKLVVISDGDFVRNEINGQTGEPRPLGFDPVFNVTFANQDFMLNMVSYLTNESGIINTRSKEIIIRPLNKTKVAAEKTYWQAINLVLPVVLIIMVGIGLTYARKRKYSVAVIKQKTEG
jgi:ABC-2 type transport system permease protein